MLEIRLQFWNFFGYLVIKRSDVRFGNCTEDSGFISNVKFLSAIERSFRCKAFSLSFCKNSLNSTTGKCGPIINSTCSNAVIFNLAATVRYMGRKNFLRAWNCIAWPRPSLQRSHAPKKYFHSCIVFRAMRTESTKMSILRGESWLLAPQNWYFCTFGSHSYSKHDKGNRMLLRTLVAKWARRIFRLPKPSL